MTLCESSIQTSTNTTILSTATYIEYYAPCNNQHSYIFEKNESIYSKRFVLEVLIDSPNLSSPTSNRITIETQTNFFHPGFKTNFFHSVFQNP